MVICRIAVVAAIDFPVQMNGLHGQCDYSPTIVGSGIVLSRCDCNLILSIPVWCHIKAYLTM